MPPPVPEKPLVPRLPVAPPLLVRPDELGAPLAVLAPLAEPEAPPVPPAPASPSTTARNEQLAVAARRPTATSWRMQGLILSTGKLMPPGLTVANVSRSAVVKWA